jgi:hypothetical protein
MANQRPDNEAFVPTYEEVNRYINAAGENNFVDAKGPCSWEDDKTKAALAKDIAAFSNSEGGGAIVIGKSETDEGKFEFTGLTADQCKSFDTTKVAQWVNNHFSPPIRLTCCPTNYDEKSFIVIVVTEFANQPAICTRDCDRRPDGKFNLAKGTIYVRTENAESSPLQAPDQVSRLVGRAVVKQQRQLREMFDSVLAGHNTVRIPTDQEQFNALRETVQHDLLEGRERAVDEGGWKLILHPDTFEARWDLRELSGIIQRCMVRNHRFPQEFPEPKPREWGISGGFNGSWAITHNGLLYFRRAYWENHQPWEINSPHEEQNRRVDAGKWLEMSSSVHMIADLFAFASRFAEEFESTTQMRYEVEASNIKGRHLLKLYRAFNLISYGCDPCEARNFRCADTLPAERIRDGWKELATDCAYKFVTIFPGGLQYAKRESLGAWIEKYSNEAA